MTTLLGTLLVISLLVLFALLICTPMLLVAWSESGSERFRAERDLQWEMEDENVAGVRSTLWLQRDRLSPESTAAARAWLKAKERR